MSERVHMVAPDGRTFTFDEWCQYLKEPGHDTGEPYRTPTGEIFEVDGFRFNVHGCCLNPHKFRLAPPGERMDGCLCYCDFRTYRKSVSRQDRRIVWWFSTFDMNCSCSAYGHLDPDDRDDENDCILTGLRKCIESIDNGVAWYDAAIENAKRNDCGDTTYPPSRRRALKMKALILDEIDKRTQLTLF